MARRIPFVVLLVAACGGGGGATVPPQEALSLRIQMLDEAEAGQSVPLLVSVRRGNKLVQDYTGFLSFETPDPGAYYPSSYRLTEDDAGERLFTSGFIFPRGVHVLTVTADGIDEPARIGISVEAGSMPPLQVPTTPAPPSLPGEPEYFRIVDVYEASAGLQDIALGDVDGDGDLDLAIGGDGMPFYGIAVFQLWLNNGAGKFAKSSDIAAAFVQRLAFIDADGDGDQDLAGMVANGTTWTGRLWLNDGSGGFQDAGQNLGTGTDLAFGDVDGDGDSDLVLSGQGGFLVRTNDGKGDFETLESQGASHDGHRVVLSDLDGDGDLDLVANQQIWRNNGSGKFTATGQVVGIDTTAAAAADMDGDGDLDLVLGNFIQKDDLYLNNGQATFTRSDALDTGAWCTTDVALVDLDEDGDPDIVEGMWSRPGMVYINEGATFSEMNLGTSALRVAVGDLDGDGNPEFATGFYIYLVTYRND